MADAPRRQPRPVLVIGKSHHPGGISFGPEVVVWSIARELVSRAPELVSYAEPREVFTILRLLFRRSTRIVHFLSTGRWSWLAPAMRFLLRKQVISTFHGYAPVRRVAGTVRRINQGAGILQARIGLTGSAVIVSVSDLLLERARSLHPGAHHTVISNPLSPAFSTTGRAPVHDGRTSPLRLLIVGFGPHKGIEMVLDALQILGRGSPMIPSWTLTLVGVTRSTDAYHERLRTRLARFGDRVEVLRALPHEEMPALYLRHDVLFLLSTDESFGLAVLEAMASGVIPVVSDRVGSKDLIANGRTGYIIPLGDTVRLAETIGNLIRNDGAIDPTGLRAVASRATPAAAVGKYLALYNRVLGGPPRVLFVTNLCPHYRVRVFALLSASVPVRFLFFGRSGTAPAGLSGRGPGAPFDGEYLRALRIPGTRLRIVPLLYTRMLFGEYDVLLKCINGKAPLLLAFLIARLRGKRFILWTGLWRYPSTLLHRMGRPVVRRIYRKADAVVAYGSHVRLHLLAEGVRPERVFLAPQAIDVHRFSLSATEDAIRRMRKRLPPDCGHIVLFVGRLAEEKGIAVLLHAASLVQRAGWTLVLAGDGRARAAHAATAARCGLKNVVFLGHVENAALAPLFALATVTVLPSITTRSFREPWGLVVNEAFSQGCPVVVTDAVGAAAGGMVIDGCNGFVVPEGSPERLASALDQLLGEPALRASMAQHARSTSANWTQERMVRGFIDAINSCGIPAATRAGKQAAG